MLGRKAKHVNSASLFHWRDGQRGKLCLVTGNDGFPVLAYFRKQHKHSLSICYERFSGSLPLNANVARNGSRLMQNRLLVNWASWRRSVEDAIADTRADRWRVTRYSETIGGSTRQAVSRQLLGAYKHVGWAESGLTRSGST